eukprot:scaffold8649_cov185-Amphora_coffeaeformis.AAC.5
MTKCPFCGAFPVQDDDICPGTPSCGSLEGITRNEELLARPPRRLFGYDWARGYVAPFLGVHRGVISEALAAAAVTASDVLVDLGSGDGRICHAAAAAEFGATAVGVELDPALLQQARDALMAHHPPNVQRRVSFRRQDLLTVHLKEFSVVTVFLLPETLERLVPRFRTMLQRGGRIVSFGWKIHKLGEPSYQHTDDTEAKKLSSSAKGSNDDTYSGLLTSWFVYLPEKSIT